MVLKKIIWILAILIVCNISYAEQQTLGTFKIDSCINLIQICSNCTYNNVTSIIYPNSSVLTQNKLMARNGTEYRVEFCNTSQYGTYLVYGIGDLDGIPTVWGYDFFIVSSNEELTIAKAILYFGGIFILIISLILSILGIIKSDILWSKYGFICLTYLLLILTSFTGWSIAKSFITNSDFIVNALYTIWLILMIGLLPFIIISFAYITIAIAKIKEWKNLMKKGYTEEEADWIAFGRKR